MATDFDEFLVEGFLHIAAESAMIAFAAFCTEPFNEPFETDQFSVGIFGSMAVVFVERIMEVFVVLQ